MPGDSAIFEGHSWAYFLRGFFEAEKKQVPTQGRLSGKRNKFA